MITSITDHASVATLSANELFRAYQNTSSKTPNENNASRSDNVRISDEARQAFENQNNQNAPTTEKTSGSYTFASANHYNTGKNPPIYQIEGADLVATGSLKSGATVSVYTSEYLEGEERIPGTSQKIMAEITQKDGSTELIAITENTVISEDAFGKLVITEVPRSMQATGLNADGSQAFEQAPMSLQGTDGNDIIINIFEDTDSINSGAGDDTIISFHSVNNIDLGDGDNKLQMMKGSVQNVSAGIGNNFLESMSMNSHFDNVLLGDGNNTVKLQSIGAMVMGDGNNFLSAGRVNNLSAGNGNNNIAVSSIQDLNIGDGNNDISAKFLAKAMSVGDGSNNINIAMLNSNALIDLGIGSNSLKIDHMNEGSSVNSKGGDQDISVMFMKDANLNLSDGNHKIKVEFFDGSNIKTGDGNSEFSIDQMNGSMLDIGIGNNKFNIQSLRESTINIKKDDKMGANTNDEYTEAENADDTGKNVFFVGLMKDSKINGGDGDTRFNIESMDKSVINSGKGNDVFNFGDLGGGNITTGEGNDIINVEGSIWGHQNFEPMNIEMGAGENELNVKGHAHKLQFISANDPDSPQTGNDSVRIGSFLSDSNIDTGYATGSDGNTNTGYGTGSDAKTDTGYGADSVNIGGFIYKSNVTYGTEDGEQIKPHEGQRGLAGITAGVNFAKTNPEESALLTETLKKSPFYTGSPMRAVYGV